MATHDNAAHVLRKHIISKMLEISRYRTGAEVTMIMKTPTTLNTSILYRCMGQDDHGGNVDQICYALFPNKIRVYNRLETADKCMRLCPRMLDKGTSRSTTRLVSTKISDIKPRNRKHRRVETAELLMECSKHTHSGNNWNLWTVT